jgi:hypothetical protein
MTAEEILIANPGLRRNELDRAAKKLHLARQGYSRERAKEIIDEIYGVIDDWRCVVRAANIDVTTIEPHGERPPSQE